MRQRHLVLVLVIAGHALIVAYLLRHLDSIVAQPERNSSQLLLLDLSSPKRSPPVTPLDAVQTEKTIARGRRTPRPKDSISSDARSIADAPAPLNSSTAEALTDWYEEAEQVAKSQAELILKDLKHVCDEAALRGEYPQGCRKYKKPDAWKPEPRKFGIAGLLPYVRLGKRCIVGLGFFGCGVGKLPEADKHVLDDMREPDRPRSSAPDRND